MECMKVYIELVILNNFAVTFLIARLSYCLLAMPPNKYRMLLASAAGTLAAVCYPFVSNALILAAFKLICGLTLSVILFKPKKLVKGAVFFFFLTFTFGGAMFFVGYLVHGSLEKALTLPFATFPIGAVLLGGYVVYGILNILIRKLFKHRDMKQFLYDAEIEIFGVKIECKAFLDSGNRLYDDKSGLPIVIAGIKTLSKALSDEQMTQLVTGKTKGFKDAHYVDCNSVGGKSKLMVFRPDEVVVYEGDKANIINDVMLGVMFKRMTDVENYGLILNPAVMIGA